MNQLNRLLRVHIAVCIGVTSLLLSPTTAAGNCQDLTSTQWLSGHWQSKTPNSVIREFWEQIDANNMAGEGSTMTLETEKATFTESLRIIRMGGSVYYLAKPQENVLPVPFKLIECSNGLLRFSNPNHDFPKVIEYHRTGDKKMRATVKGSGSAKFSIDYKRV